MVQYIEENGINITGLITLGCDGIDGETSGPTSFSGTIGKLLHTSPTLPVVKHDLINSDNFPFMDASIVKDLSSDQKYLQDICLFILGIASDACSCRVLRLYIRTEKTEPYYNKVHSLAKFIIKCYAPVWFLVIKEQYVADAAKHFFQMVKRSRYLPVDQRKVVDKHLEINFFSGHSEFVLLAMLLDESKKQKAVQIIEQVRKQRPNEYRWTRRDDPQEAMEIDGEQEKESPIRKYTCPQFDFTKITPTSSDDQYDNLLDFIQIQHITEPPLTMAIPIGELINFTAPHPSF